MIAVQDGENLTILYSMVTSRQDKIMRVFGERLKEARVKAGYGSATKFANIMGLEPHTYRFYERGKSWPGPEILTRMCEILEITPNYLLPEAAGDSAGKEDRRQRQGSEAA